jgi:hypothetical protein
LKCPYDLVYNRGIETKVRDMDAAVAVDEMSTIQGTAEELYRAKIQHILTVYPQLSPMHLQISLGTSTPASIWKPILNAMIREGVVKEEVVPFETPSKRSQNYTRLSLAS